MLTGRAAMGGGGGGAEGMAHDTPRVCVEGWAAYIYIYISSLHRGELHICIYMHVFVCLSICVYLYKINISASLSVQSHRPCKIRSPPMQAQVTHLGSRGHRPSDLGHRLLPLVFTGSEEKRQRHPHR